MGLNHIYKVIWSKTKNAWVVVSEIAKRDGKSSVKSVVTSVAGKGIAATVVAMILCGGITSAASFATPGATATGTDSVAVGDGVTATGEGGVAIGARTVAEKTTGNELYLQTGTGLKSSAAGEKSLAIQGEATEENATAIQGVAKGQGAVAIGYSLSKGKRAVGLGWNSMALGDSSIAIGEASKAAGKNSIAVLGQATGKNSIAVLGQATVENGIAVGFQAKVETDTVYYQNGIAIGTQSHSIGDGIAVGYGSTANGYSSLAFGRDSLALGTENIALGSNARLNGSRSNAIGSSALAEGNYSSAIGNNGYVLGDNSVSINSVVRGNSSIAINGSAGLIQFFDASTYYGTLLENANNGTVNKSVALGGDVTTDKTVRLGGSDYSFSNQGIHRLMSGSPVIRTDKNELITPTKIKAQFHGGGTDPIFPLAHATGGNVIGYVEGTLSNSIYLGYNSFAITDNVETDNETSSSGEKSLHTKSYDAAGHVVTSTSTTGGAFGLVSKTDIDDTTFTNFAGGQSVGAVTIGGGGTERRIQNVAAGEMSATSTDAVNGSQLYSTAKTLLDRMTNYVHVNDGTTTQKAGTASSNKGVLDTAGGATGKKSVAIGIDTQATGENGVAVGNTAKATGKNSVAHGTDAEATEEDAIAIGNGAKAQGEKSISIGTGNIVKAAKSSVIGDPSYIDTTATGTHVQGNDNGTVAAPIMAKDSTFMGNNNLAGTAGTEGIHVVGNNNNIQSSNVMVLGNGITAGTGYDGAVILGNASATRAYTAPTNTTINGVTLDASKYAGTTAAGSTLSQGSIVSVGDAGKERQIKNVAAGEISATSTDAVTGSQLYGAVKALTESNSSPDVYVHVNDGTTTQKAGNATTNAGKADEKGGATGKDSIAIGKNTKAEGEKSVSIGSAVKSTKDYALTIGSLYANNTGEYGLAIASDTMNLSGNFAIGIGGGSVSGDNAISIGANYIAASRNIGIGDDIETSASAEGTIILGNFSTATSKMATVIGNNSSAGYIFEQRVGAEGITTDNANADNSVVIGNNLSATTKNTVIIGMNERKVGQNDRNQFVNPNKGTYTDNYGHPPVERYNEGTLENSVYLGHESYAFTDDATKDSPISSSGEKSIHTKRYDTGTDTVITSTNTTGGAFGLVSKSTIDDTEFKNFAGEQSVGAVTIGGGGTERRIQNVAAGEMSATSTDAVNGSQLYSTAKTLLDGMTNYVHVNDGTTTQKAGTASSNKGILDAVGGATGKKSIAIGVDTQAAGENGVAVGNTVKATGKNSVAQGTEAEATEEDAIAIGNGAKAQGEKSISIGTGNIVKAAKSSVIGDPSYIDTTATGTHVQGNNNGTATNPIKASESTFMGNTNLAGTAGTTGIHVVGNSNTVDSSNVMVMGNNVTVGTGLDGAVVLGHASSADQYAAATDSTINGVTFEAAGYAGNTGLNKGSIVSVGASGAERQIKNVAAGAVTATSTDAVNGSQLYKTAETILKMPINMAGDSGDTVGLKLGKTVNIKGSVTSGADVTDGNIAVVGDKATSTLSLKMAKNLTGLTSGTFTDATGNQTVINGAGVTVTPTGTGATPISITTSGINAGNQEIKGVKKGTTDDAAVNKKQMDDALAGISSTLTINDGTTDGSVNIKTGKLKVVGESGTNALVTTTVSGDTITVGTSTKLQNAVTAAEKSADKDLSNLSATGSSTVKTLAQDAVKVAGTGLATVSDVTAAGVKTYTVNVDEGKLVIDDTTGKLGATGATQGTVQGKNGVATTQDVASVVNSAIDKTKQALDDAKHNFAGDDATVISRKHGEQLNIKGGASTTASDLTSGNIAVVGDTTSGTLNIKMAKALTGLTSATYTDTSGNTQTVTGGSSTISDASGNSTVVSKGGVTTTDAAGNTITTAPTGVTVTPAGTGATPISVTTSGISAGNKEIKNVANGTTDDAAVNKKQMDDALKGATDNTVSLGSESGSTTAKKLSTTGGITFNIKGETGANALITTSASGDDVTIAPTAKLTAAVTAAEKSADKDLSNLNAAGDTYIKNLAKSAASWNVETNGAGTTAVAGGETVNFINGDNIAITNTGRAITIGTAKNVSFDKVTVGGIVLDKNTGINAGNKEIKGVATGTAADSAVNKAQMDAAITAAASGSLSTETVEAGSTANGKLAAGDTNLATVSGLTGTAKGETYAVTVSENAVKAVAKTAAQDAVKVAGTGLATVSDATAAGVKTYTVNVDEGKLVIDDTTDKIGANGATQGTVQGKNGVATTQDVATVVNSAIDKTKQALDDAKHNFAGDDATVISRKHGEQLNIKGGASTTATDLTSGNIAVVGDTTSGTLNIKMAKALTGLTSATYTDAAGNTQTVTGGSSTISDAAGHSTVVSKGGVTTTDGTNTTTVAPSGVTATDGTHTVTLGGSGINAGGTEIKNVGKATTDDAAVNKKQMDDAVKAATDSVSTLGDNKVSLGSDSGTTTAKKLSTTGGITFNIKGDSGANALITTSATGDDVTITPTAKLSAAVTAAENAANKDLSNLSAAGDTYIKNLAKTAASWNVETNGAGTTAVAGGDTVNFINGDNIAITNTGRSITIGTAKNVSFDKVTVGGIVLDKNTGIDAGGKEITNVGPATSGNSAVNKTQMDTAIANAQTAATSTEKVVAKTLTGDTNLATVTGQTGTAKGETYEVAVSENAVKAVAQTAAQDAVKVTGTDLATVTDSTTSGVKTYNVDVKTGNLVVNAAGQAGATGTTGAGGASGADGVATTQNVASAINAAITKSKADTTQALADAEHKFDGDTGTTSVRKHGEVLSIKGGVTTPADLTTGNLGVVSDGAGTLNIRLAKVLSGLTSASFTTAGGDTTMINGGGVTITPSATGATPISITTAGINAGNKEIKGIANGTTADAAVNKGQLDAAVLAAAGGSLSTEKVVAKTLTGDTNLATVTGQTGTAKGETYEVAVSENAVKAVAQTAAQDAVKVTGTGLATVTDSTTGGVKTYNVNVDEGKLVIDDTTGKLGATGAAQGTTAGKNGVATTQDVATVVNSAIDKTKQALDDAKHNFAGDDATVISRKHGEQLNIKGGASTTATDLTSGNIAVVGDTTSGTLNIKLAKVLTGLTSATYTDAAGNTQTVTGGSSTITDGAGHSTVVSKGGVTTTDGTNTTTVAPSGITATNGTHTVTLGGSGINAGGTEIKNVGKATTDDAAVNKKQMDDAVKAATDSVSTLGDNKVSLGSDAGTTTAKKLSTTGGIKFNIKGDTGTNALITTSATGDDVTITPTAKLSAAVTAAENAANKDLSNLSAAGDTYIKNLAKTAASWNVETNGAGTTAVAGGDTVNFINGDNIAITNTGRSITIGTAKNVSFDKVTVGGIVLDKNTGIDAGGKEITNVGPATSGNSAVNKTQMDTAITNAVNKATTDAKHDFGGDDTTVVTRKHGEKLSIKGGASTTAADLTAGNIAVLGDAATGTLNIRMAKALTGLSSATFTTPSGTTVINGGGMTITPSATGAAPISITTNGINAGNTEIKNVAAGTTPNSAVNKQQMDSAISNATANVGFHTAGNTGTGSVSNGQTLTITGTNGIETNASGQSITVGLDAATRAQINNATTTANNAAKKDLSNIDNTGKQMIKDTAAWNVKVNSAAAETVKGGDTVTFKDGDNIKVTNTGKDITIATKKDVSFDKVTVGNVVIDKNTNRISGLANAVNNDEAVNLGQMNAAISTVTAGANTIKYKANGGTQNSVALTTGFDFKGDSNIQITADPANSGVINYKLNPALTGITSISGGTGAPTITLNAGSGSNPGNVSINSNLDMGGKQINNIGAATHAGDAVNKAQMDQALQNIAGASSNVAKSYAYKAGAGAAALAALKPIQYDPLEPTQIMAGIGNYKSQTAVALGVAHYTNENTMFNFGVSLDSHDGIVNAGVTHKFGYSPEKKAIPDRYKGGPISSIYVMQDEVTALQAIVQKQAAENEALRQQNEDMQRKVDMILSKIH